MHALQILIVLFVTNCYRHTMSTEEEPENSGDIPDEDLCVVCLLRRRQAAFIQCGHRVCCVPCAQRVEQGSNPLCPVCRQIVTSIVRVFDSWLEHLVSQLLIRVSHFTTIPVMYLGETLWHLTTSYPMDRFVQKFHHLTCVSVTSVHSYGLALCFNNMILVEGF